MVEVRSVPDMASTRARADGAVVRPRAMGTADPAWCQQAMLPHQAQHAALGGADAGEAQPRPDLAMALAVEGTRREQRADRPDQRLVGIGPSGPGRRLG